VLQCVAVCCNTLQHTQWLREDEQEAYYERFNRTMCCSVLQCVAVCCSVLQCVATHCNIMSASIAQAFVFELEEHS